MSAPTAALAGFTASLETAALPAAIRALATQHVLDTVAGMYASADIPEARSVCNAFAGSDAETAGKLGMLTHAAESDPIHAGTTLCAGLIAAPPALVLAQDGRDALAAIVVGYEVVIRIGEALGSGRLLGMGWWPTAVLGSAGAAVSAARALRLDADTTRNALGLALVQSGGLGAGAAEAPESRNLLAANAVRTGVEAALAAQRGLKGPSEPLTGDRSVLDAFGGEPDASRLLKGLGTDWKIAATSLKRWPCALQAQSALDALQRVVEESGIAPSDIGKIRIFLPEAMRRIVDRPGPPASRFAAAANMRFLAAILLGDGDIAPVRMAGPYDGAAIAALMETIFIEADPALEPLHPAAWPARVEIDAAAGTFTAETRNPPGHPDAPLPMAFTVARFRDWSAPHLPEKDAQSMIDAISGLENGGDMGGIVASLRDLL
jgi:2-methylcitrate dehydratase PrpD